MLEHGRNRMEIKITTDGSCFSNVSLVYILLKRSTDTTTADKDAANKCALVKYDIYAKANSGVAAFNKDTTWAASDATDEAKTHCKAGDVKIACDCSDTKGANAKEDAGMFF